MSLQHKLEQLHAALAEMHVTEKLPFIRPTTRWVGNQFAASIDFTKGTNQATAENRVSLLLHNIACLKDHLKSWCNKNGKPFTGEQLIDTNRDVAIIHDLWNLDKHAELNRPSRSGLSPALLEPAHTGLRIKGGGEITVPLVGAGPVQTQGAVSLQIVAAVVDGHGNPLGDLEAISLKAVAAWEAEFVKSGLSLVPPSERKKEYDDLSAQTRGQNGNI